MATIFETHNLTYDYPGGRPALAGVNLTVMSGEQLALLGANGSGKSTFLKLLDGLIFADTGRLSAFDRQLSEDLLENEGFAADFRRRVAFVFQDSDIQLFSPTVFEELVFGPLQLEIEAKDAVKRADDILKMLDLAHLRDRPPHQLSGGEKKKVALAAALTVAPEVLLLDEPTNNLDPRSRSWLFELLIDLGRTGKTIIMSTQDLDLASSFADRLVVLGEDHKVLADGETERILTDTDLLISANLIHEHDHRHGSLSHRHPHAHYAGHKHVHEKDQALAKRAFKSYK